ncbi:MAG: LPXTG cell wall anchor domain-containing protein [Candidatus Gracilibacteria bacterium]|nr:LPXTG cell wall anchor domain-containing protein [Candidatus Gracilibacteria bacterium]
MNFKIKTFLMFGLLISSFGLSFATGTINTAGTGTNNTSTGNTINIPSIKVMGINFIDDKTFGINLSNSISGISDDSEVKILEDISIISSTKDETNSKKMVLTLSNNLVDGQRYSLVSVSDAVNTSMDFNLSGDKLKILNPTFSKNDLSIEYISVIDQKTIEIYFSKDLLNQNVEFKFFKEITPKSVSLKDKILNVKFINPLTGKKDYIAILSLKDLNNKDIEIENALYDFTTPEFNIAENIVPLADNNMSTGVLADNGNNLTTTGANIENVAMNAEKTPDTGTQTNILIILAMILSLTLFLFRKKVYKL